MERMAYLDDFSDGPLKLSSSDRETATRLVYDPEAPERSLRADLLESKGFTFVLHLGIAESLLIAWIAVMLAVD